jgi:hypothetical protein
MSEHDRQAKRKAETELKKFFKKRNYTRRNTSNLEDYFNPDIFNMFHTPPRNRQGNNNEDDNLQLPVEQNQENQIPPINEEIENENADPPLNQQNDNAIENQNPAAVDLPIQAQHEIPIQAQHEIPIQAQHEIAIQVQQELPIPIQQAVDIPPPILQHEDDEIEVLVDFNRHGNIQPRQNQIAQDRFNLHPMDRHRFNDRNFDFQQDAELRNQFNNFQDRHFQPPNPPNQQNIEDIVRNMLNNMNIQAPQVASNFNTIQKQIFKLQSFDGKRSHFNQFIDTCQTLVNSLYPPNEAQALELINTIKNFKIHPLIYSKISGKTINNFVDFKNVLHEIIFFTLTVDEILHKLNNIHIKPDENIENFGLRLKNKTNELETHT